jgi:hypothetical protein
MRPLLRGITISTMFLRVDAKKYVNQDSSVVTVAKVSATQLSKLRKIQQVMILTVA